MAAARTSDALRVTAAVAAVAWAGAVALALHERRALPAADREPPLTGGPLVSVVVPARDEARGIGAAVRSLRALEYRDVDVVVVDDRSRDGTAAAARAAAGDDPRVRVVAGGPLPAGWVGKPWACHQGARLARGEWLLFTDADVVHRPDSLGRALALARRLGRGGVTLLPTVDCEGVAERVVTPAALTAIATFVAPGPLARRAGSPVAMAAGGYILVERSLYRAVGGHEAIRGRMVDDVWLAARVKRAGALLVPLPAGPLARLRMYHGAREVWEGWSKNASFAATGGPAKGLAAAGALALLALAPPAAAAAGLRRREPGVAAAGLAGVAACAALQRLAAPYAATPRRYALTLPLGLLVLAAATARGALDRMRGLGPRWRGRRYPLAR
ncbi:glycosyltransferase [Miltoncostaea marina]|uniref:glycosyltransferase n=1 Tax=Miltoncostaea marina TaxID=2843215 RepID=UPI001C3CF19A|nr:glycosyltransferase [Miltoncostaea marina]